MASQTVERILLAERSAAEIISKAEETAHKIIEKAAADAEKHIENEWGKTDALINSIEKLRQAVETIALEVCF